MKNFVASCILYLCFPSEIRIYRKVGIECSENRFLVAGWSSGNTFVSGVGGLWFKSWVGQIENCTANS